MAWPIIEDDDGSGETGTPTDYALFQQVKAYIDAAQVVGPQEPWIAFPYLAGNFSAAGGWAVTAANQQLYRYRRNGKSVDLMIYLHNTTLAGASPQLNINLPIGPSANGWIGVECFIAGQAAGTITPVVMQVVGGQPHAAIMRDFFATPWVAGSIYLTINGKYETP